MSISSEPSGLVERTHFASGSYTIDTWVMRPGRPGKYPVIIYNHGSRMQAEGHIDASCSTLSFDTPPWHGVRMGACAVVFPEGRGYAGSTGPKLDACTSWPEVWNFLEGRAQDVVASVAWLGAQPWADTSRILLCGCSHGAIVSLLAQASAGVSGTVLQAPGIGDHAHELANSELSKALNLATAPILLQHAEHDLHAPIELSRSLHRHGRAVAKNICLREYPFCRSISSHDQFAWENRHIWGTDFDQFAGQNLGVGGPIVYAPK